MLSPFRAWSTSRPVSIPTSVPRPSDRGVTAQSVCVPAQPQALLSSVVDAGAPQGWQANAALASSVLDAAEMNIATHCIERIGSVPEPVGLLPEAEGREHWIVELQRELLRSLGLDSL